MADPNTGNPGTGQPGGTTQNPGNGTTTIDPAQFVSKEDFGKTAAVISGLQKTLKDLSSSLLTADKLAEYGLLEKGDDGTYKPRAGESTTKKKPEGTSEPEPWKKEIEALQKQLADKDAEVVKEREKVETTERNRALIAALTKAGAINADRDYVHIAGKVTKSDAGGYIIAGKDKYGQDIEIPIDQFAATWLKDNPELMKASGSAGSGTTPGQSAGGKGNVIPFETWNNPDWYKANYQKFDSGEYIRGRKATA